MPRRPPEPPTKIADIFPVDAPRLADDQLQGLADRFNLPLVMLVPLLTRVTLRYFDLKLQKEKALRPHEVRQHFEKLTEQIDEMVVTLYRLGPLWSHVDESANELWGAKIRENHAHWIADRLDTIDNLLDVRRAVVHALEGSLDRRDTRPVSAERRFVRMLGDIWWMCKEEPPHVDHDRGGQCSGDFYDFVCSVGSMLGIWTTPPDSTIRRATQDICDQISSQKGE